MLCNFSPTFSKKLYISNKIIKYFVKALLKNNNVDISEIPQTKKAAKTDLKRRHLTIEFSFENLMQNTLWL